MSTPNLNIPTIDVDHQVLNGPGEINAALARIDALLTGEALAGVNEAWGASPLLTPPVLLPQAAQGNRFRRRYMRNFPHGNVNTNLRQALFAVTRDLANWQNTAPIEVIIRTVGQGSGGYTRSLITGAYTDDPGQVITTDAVGFKPIKPLMNAGAYSSGQLRTDYVYLDLPPYTDVLVELTYNHTETPLSPQSAAGLAAIGAGGFIQLDTGYADNVGTGGSVWTGPKSDSLFSIEPVHYPGSLLNNWLSDRPVTYYKDRGRVYLAGSAHNSSGATTAAILQLPDGYHASAGGIINGVVFSNDGTISLAASASTVNLDGIDFRATS